jgi:hypothetical protein
MKDTQLEWQRSVIRDEYKDLKLNELRNDVNLRVAQEMQSRRRTGFIRVEKKMGK